LDAVLNYLPFALLLFNVAIAWGLWAIRHAVHEQIAEGFAKHVDRIASNDHRLTTIEAELRHAPTHGDMAFIRTELAKLGGEIKTQSAVLGGVSETQKALGGSVSIMNQYLLERARP
jgi:hypothetical protein